jgi:hypothetical protein
MLRSLTDCSLKRKKALSEIVSYALLLGLTISMAGIVFIWLRGYTSMEEAESCPEGISLVITDFNVVNPSAPGSGEKPKLNVTIQNRGLFNVDGFVIRVGTHRNSQIATDVIFNSQLVLIENYPLQGYALPSSGFLETGQSTTIIFNETLGTSAEWSKIPQVCIIDVQPYINSSDGNVTFCAKASARRVECR